MKKVINIILEEIQNFHDCLLNESISDIMYHFTYAHKLYGILKSNEILLSPSFINPSDSKSKNLYFLSLSTSRSLRVGFGASMGTNQVARLTMNGRALNQNYKSQAVDYWGHTRDPKKSEVDNMSRYDELEERILTDKDKIEPANRYISVIEILNPDTNQASALKKLCDDLNIKFYAYDNADYFNGSIKTKAINVEALEGEIDASSVGIKSDLFEIIAYLTFKDDELKQKIYSTLTKSNIDIESIKKRVDEIQESKLNYYLRVGDDFHITDLGNSIRATLHNNQSSTNKIMRYVIREFGIDMKKNNITSIKAYLNYKVWKGKKPQKQFNEEFNNKILIFINKKYQDELKELKEYRYWGQVGDEYYDNIYDYPPIKNLLDSKIEQLKKFYSKYILNNNDMFKYSFYIGSDEATKELNLGRFSDDKYDPQFDSVLNGVDGGNRGREGNDLVQTLRFIIQDVNSFTDDEIQKIQTEYQNQFK